MSEEDASVVITVEDARMVYRLVAREIGECDRLKMEGKEWRDVADRLYGAIAKARGKPPGPPDPPPGGPKPKVA